MMLRVVTQGTEARAELGRISQRLQDTQVQAEQVREILAQVQQRGDQALVDYTRQFDQQELTPAEFLVSGSELDAAYQQVSPELLAAIRLAHKRITEFHQQRVPQTWVQFAPDGMVLGKRYTPVERAGVYVPGGRASYPSTVLMNCIPAKVAGVSRIVMVTPPGGERAVNPAVLVAAQECGVQEIYRIGGAQAIGALAFGTETIPPVDVITGPGNVYVTLAKKQVYGRVGIDSLAGPSEVLIIADETAQARHIAADLLAQAEHDPLAAAILLTTDGTLAQAVVQEVAAQLEHHPRRLLTEKSIAHYGLVVVVESLAQAAELANGFAPEHLELAVAEPWDLLPQIRHAGAIFLGHHTPEALGDYLAGPNHTLPTAGAARFSSALSVETFLKSSSIVCASAAALHELGEAVIVLAETEGLHSHAESVRLRLNS
ncbi:MAG: histidinol dehydrogenase [Gloeomargarita sp. HHBFW_bins_162]